MPGSVLSYYTRENSKNEVIVILPTSSSETMGLHMFRKKLASETDAWDARNWRTIFSAHFEFLIANHFKCALRPQMRSKLQGRKEIALSLQIFWSARCLTAFSVRWKPSHCCGNIIINAYSFELKKFVNDRTKSFRF